MAGGEIEHSSSVDWPLDFVVKAADGRHRLPDGTTGQLPLFFDLRATRLG